MHFYLENQKLTILLTGITKACIQTEYTNIKDFLLSFYKGDKGYLALTERLFEVYERNHYLSLTIIPILRKNDLPNSKASFNKANTPISWCKLIICNY